MSENAVKEGRGHDMHADDFFGDNESDCDPTAQETPPAVVPPVVDEPEPDDEVAGTEAASSKPDKKPTVKGTEAVPTAVDAGIGGSGPTMTGTSPVDLLAQMLVGGGLALLMAAGWMQIARRPDGTHQA